MFCSARESLTKWFYNNQWVKPIGFILFFVVTVALIYGIDFRISFGNQHRPRLSRAEQVIRKRNRFMYDITVHPEVYVYATLRNDMCFLREKIEKQDFPVIHSVFSDPVSKNVVFIAVRYFEDKWDRDPYVCIFQNGYRTLSDPVVHDYKSFGYVVQYLAVITCPIPEELHTLPNMTVDLIRVTDEPMWYLYAAENITVCPSGIPIYRYYNLVMCTMVKNVDEFLPDWIEYHIYQGVDHVFLYDNEKQNKSTLIGTVQKYIERGVVTVIPWSHEPTVLKTYLEVQIAHENDCVWRLKHNAKWIIKIDVDEYLQPMQSRDTKIVDVLQAIHPSKIASLHVQNWFFGRPKKSAASEETIFERNTWRPRWPTAQNIGRDKNIIHPLNVHYFKIHGVKVGGDSWSLDPYKEMRLVHYRMDNTRTRYFDLPPWEVQDFSMVRLWQDVQRWKLRNWNF